MKRILPDEHLRKQPCAIAAVATALGVTSRKEIEGRKSAGFAAGGYLPLKGMDRLVEANFIYKRRKYFRPGTRPMLREYAHAHEGHAAIICVEGHYVYFGGKDYYSFFLNGGDRVVCVWELN